MRFSVAPVFIPGPRPDPILGWRGALIPFGSDPIGFLMRSYQRYGPIVGLSRTDPVMLLASGQSTTGRSFRTGNASGPTSAAGGPCRATRRWRESAMACWR